VGLRTVEITQKQKVQLWVLSGQILKIFDFFFGLFAFGNIGNSADSRAAGKTCGA
jgi:hypothetical protein